MTKPNSAIGTLERQNKTYSKKEVRFAKEPMVLCFHNSKACGKYVCQYLFGKLGYKIGYDNEDGKTFYCNFVLKSFD